MIEEAFIWLGSTSVGVALQHSTAGFAATEAIHIVAFSLIGGTILVTDLAVLGVVLETTASDLVFRQLRLLYFSGLALVAASGVLLIAAGPYKYYTNPLFPVKLALLVVAATLQAILSRRLHRRPAPERAARLLAAASLIAWTAVVIAGRWLGLI
jgi:hypothetical membrane protein